MKVFILVYLKKEIIFSPLILLKNFHCLVIQETIAGSARLSIFFCILQNSANTLNITEKRNICTNIQASTPKMILRIRKIMKVLECIWYENRNPHYTWMITLSSIGDVSFSFLWGYNSISNYPSYFWLTMFQSIKKWKWGKYLVF